METPLDAAEDSLERTPSRHATARDLFRSLLSILLLMDFRNQAFGRVTRSKPQEPFSPLFWVTGQNLLVSIFLSLLLFARVEAWFFAFATLCLSMLAVTTSIIVEFNEVVIDPQDAGVLGHLPIPVGTYTSARIVNLLLYLTYVVVSLNLVPAIVGLGLRETTLWFLPAYVIATTIGSYCLAGLLILIYAIVFRSSWSAKFQEVFAWTQTGLMFITFYGGQAVLRDSGNRFEMVAYRLPEWLLHTPPAWLADWVVSDQARTAFSGLWVVVLGSALTVGVWGIVYLRLRQIYAHLGDTKTASRSFRAEGVSRFGFGWLIRRICRTTDQRVGYWFTRTMVRRDLNLKMRILPSFAITAAFVGIGLFSDQFADPLVDRGRAGVVSLIAIYSVAFPVPTILFSLRASRYYEAIWSLLVAPIQNRKEFICGVEKAIHVLYTAPVLCALGLLLIWRWENNWHALLHWVDAVLAVILVTNLAADRVLRELPFSLPLAKGESLGAMGPIGMIVASVTGSLALVHYLMSANVLLSVLYSLALLAITIGVAGHRRFTAL